MIFSANKVTSPDVIIYNSIIIRVNVVNTNNNKLLRLGMKTTKWSTHLLTTQTHPHKLPSRTVSSAIDGAFWVLVPGTYLYTTARVSFKGFPGK